MQNGLHCVDHVRGGEPAKRRKAKARKLRNHVLYFALQTCQRLPGATHVNEPADQHARGIGQGVIVGDVALFHGPAFEQTAIGQSCQGHGCHAHGGSVAGIAFIEGTGQGPVVDVAGDAAAAGVAHVDWPAFEPGRETSGNVGW